MLRLIKIFKLFLFLFFWSSLFSQNPELIEVELPHTSFTIEDGLSQGYITSIKQDSEGFLWVGTMNGLNRFDGEQFKTFTSDPADPYSISDNYIKQILEVDDYLVVGTKIGLNFYYKPDGRFYKIRSAGQLQEELDYLSIGMLCQDVIDQIWISNNTDGAVYKINLPSGLVRPDSGKIQKLDIIKIPNVDCRSLLHSDEQFIYWLNAENKCQKIDIKTNDTKILMSNPYSSEAFIDIKYKYTARLRTSNKTLFFLNEDEPFPITINWNFEWIHYFKEDRKLWYSRNKKLYVINNWDPSEGAPLKNKAELVAKNVIGLYRDHSGIIWAGTGGFGLIKINPRQLQTKTYMKGNSVTAKPFMSSSGDIFYRARGDNFKIISKSAAPINLPKSLFRNLTMANFYEYKKNHFYIFGEAPYSQGLRIAEYSIDSGFRDLIVLSEPTSKLIQNPVEPTSYYDAPSESMWVAWREKLFQVDLKTLNVQKYNFNTLFDYHVSYISMCKTPNNHWWIGTEKGLVQAAPIVKDGKTSYDFKLHNLRNDQTVTIRHNIISSLLPDPDDENLLWIATKGGGLHGLNMNDMSFTYLNSNNGLPNDVLYGVLNDDHGNLWMSSNKGIIRYNKFTKDITNYLSADGMQSNEFNTFAYSKAADGSFLFGGVQGLNVFHPDEFGDNPTVPNVLITALEVNNQPINNRDSTGILERSIVYTDKISLPYEKNNVILEFAALEFSTPLKNKFKYFLDGVEDPWVHESTENKAQYLGLSPGNYTFKVKASNGDGIWSEEQRELEITILPPWYATTLAYFIYAFLLGFGIWQILKYRDIRYRLRLQMEQEQKEAERLKELDQAKSKLYTNITHEFRTPLTIISGLTAKFEGDEESKVIIKRNTDQLLNLVNQMLDLRKLESGEIKIHMQQRDIVKLLRYLTESFVSYAEMRHITIHFLSNENELIMDHDKEKITRIYCNLLSNAIKFTNKGGHIYIILQKEKKTKGEELQITIRDTGIGIAKEKQAHIFNRFYQVDGGSTRKGEGTGIGLTLVSELIKVIGGEINFESTYGVGSTFKISLPILNEQEIGAELLQVPDHYFDVPIAESSQMLARLSEKSSEDERASILIVEDNPDVIHYLIKCIESSYKVLIAINGKEGIIKALEEVPDIIVSDVMMPIKDGFELCATLKKDVRTSHIPIVLLTAKADIQSKLEGLRLGADAYLAKPFLEEELLLILQKQLELRILLQKRFSNISFIEKAKFINQDLKSEGVEIDFEIEDAFLKKIKSIIENDLSNSELGMSQLIKELSMSRSQIYKKVKALTGISPSNYINNIRLQHAKKLLENSSMNVSEVAYKVGFSSPGYFTTLFSKQYGKTPREIMK